ncbi:MAG: hypothetical protein ACTSVV_04090, partial [Promethearchaeota archaeon]
MIKGKKLEYRIQRLFFYLDYFSRRSVPIRNYFYPDKADLTDIDIIGITHSFDFKSKLVICDCKTGHSHKSYDRILWLAGLKQYIKANEAYFIEEKASRIKKLFANANDLKLLDLDRIEEIEKNLEIVDYIGSNKLELENLNTIIYALLKKETHTDFMRHYWFLKSNYWLEKNNIRLKQCINFIDLLKKRDFSSIHRQYLYIETIILFSVSILEFVNEIFTLSEHDRLLHTQIALKEGIISIDQQDKILRLIRGIVKQYVREECGKTPRLDSIKEIPLPDYSDDLVELIERIIANPIYSSKIPKFLDYILYESVLFM